MEWVTKKHDHNEVVQAGDGQLVVNKIWDADPTLQQNKMYQNDGSNGFTPDRGFRHIGYIPLVMYEQWLMEEYNKHKDHKQAQRTVSSPEFIKQKLKDNPFLKTCDGAI